MSHSAAIVEYILAYIYIYNVLVAVMVKYQDNNKQDCANILNMDHDTRKLKRFFIFIHTVHSNETPTFFLLFVNYI